jgi:ABC-2 type transport system permease protein
VTATTAARPPGWRPLVAIVRYTLRTSLPGRRWIGILVPCAAAILFGALSRSLGGDLEAEFADMAGLALFGLVMPVTCLVVGDAVLGAEVRSGSFTFTWLSPVPTWQIAVGRWLGGTVVAASCLAAAFAASAVVAGAGSHAGSVALAAVVGTMAYVAVFVAIGCVAKRAAVWSLAFVFLVERLLGAALAGIAQLSPSWLARATYVDLADAPERLVRDGVPHGVAGVVRLLLITAVALALSARQLHRLHLSGSSD